MDTEEYKIYKKLWEAYVLECEATETHPDLSDFSLWIEEHDEQNRQAV